MFFLFLPNTNTKINKDKYKNTKHKYKNKQGQIQQYKIQILH